MIAIFKDLIANLAAVFRHIVPGCLVLAFARLSHPSWFLHADLNESRHLWIAGIGALLAGNVVYVVHRTIIHQAVDWLVSWSSPKKYVETVGKMISSHFDLPDEIRDSMHLRNSQIILTAILGELCLVSSLWKEQSSPAADYCTFIWGFGVFAFVGSIFAHAISQHAAQKISK